jgi:hypothetical protein
MGLVNTAFTTCYNQLRSLAPSLPANGQPVLSFDPTTKLFTLKLVTLQYAVAGAINIYLNQSLYFLFNFPAFDVVFNGEIQSKLIVNTNTGTTSGLNTLVSQEIPSLDLWGTVEAIVITTSFIPSERVQNGIPQVTFNQQPVSFPQSNSTSQRIILDYSLNGAQYDNAIVYNPPIYQLFEMLDQNPLYQIDWKFWYRGRIGILRPIAIRSGAYAFVKLGFFKKKTNALSMARNV